MRVIRTRHGAYGQDVSGASGVVRSADTEFHTGVSSAWLVLALPGVLGAVEVDQHLGARVTEAVARAEWGRPVHYPAAGSARQLIVVPTAT
ncbi:MAG: hypothetical protein M0Z47_01620 [Actinomycetota bacterium]|nr:hypothetical protein [Actinomycetota bacterium]